MPFGVSKRSMDHERYIAELGAALAKGWNGFTGEIVEVPPLMFFWKCGGGWM